MIELIRYHLPTFVKHDLAPKNDFGIQKKTLGKFTKVLGIGKTPPHSEPSALSEPGSEHNLIGASAFGYVSKITVTNTIAI